VKSRHVVESAIQTLGLMLISGPVPEEDIKGGILYPVELGMSDKDAEEIATEQGIPVIFVKSLCATLILLRDLIDEDLKDVWRRLDELEGR
jgi:hypothetical protein